MDGINKIDHLPKHIKSIGQTACAQTDHGTLTGSYKFFKACKKEGIKPILGLEAYYTVNDRGAREKDELGKPYYHLILLAKNNVGLHNLFKLSSRSFTEGFYSKPRCDDVILNDHSEGLIATTACLGSRISQLIMAGRLDEAERLLLHHKAIFSDFFVELQLHSGEQQEVNAILLQLAKKHNIPIILTNDCHYQHEHDKDLHEKALCMATNSSLWMPTSYDEEAEGKKRFSFGDLDVHVASGDWMRDRANQNNIPLEALSNTVHIANSITNDYFTDIHNRYPKYKNVPEGSTVDDEIEWLVKDNLEKKFKGPPPIAYRERVNEELKVIKRMGFSDYMLIQMEIGQIADENNIARGPGRGSAAGSLVAYALGITTVDPIKYDLLFSR